MEKTKHTFEGDKQYLNEIRNFFEGLDLSELDGADKIKLDVLKDMWADYYFDCVTASYYGNEREKKSGSLFVIANCITNEEVKSAILNYTYEYIAELSDEVFSSWEDEKIDKMLTDSGMLTISNYFNMKRQFSYVLSKQKPSDDKKD